MPNFNSSREISALLPWYHQNRRDLPWRRSRNPYAIWISETMLQQTTTAAVIPYFEKFMARYPRLADLAAANDEDVLALWAGLGYYSRARNLLRAARELAKLPAFPKRFEDLLPYPGFGPYTARAVSSIAFDEPVGVIDGNVIRVLSRRFDLAWPWWENKHRSQLQTIADDLAKVGPASEINQALMELGAQICTPKNPHCNMCPWMTSCEARKNKTVLQRPTPRPRRETEIWVWNAELQMRDKKIKLVKNATLPFLSSHWVLPGVARKQIVAPAKFSFKHSVTHHDIFVKLTKTRSSKTGHAEKWITLDDLPKHAPSSVIKKALAFAQNKMLLVALVASFFMLSCRSTQPQIGDAPKTAPAVIPQVKGTRQLTTIGENYRPRLSPDGRFMLFLSEKRPNHPHAQVYELDLATSGQHRVTFQDGTVYDATYAGSNDTLIYSSDTDQIKENPIYIRQALEKFRPTTKVESNRTSVAAIKSAFSGDLPLTDIYVGNKDGRNIKRLTNTAGFDGEINVRPKHSEAVIVSERQGFLQLAMLNIHTGATWSVLTEKNNDEWPALSSDGKRLLWMHIIGPTESEIWSGDAHAGHAGKILGAGVVFAWPQWSPISDEIIFASNKDAAKNFELYVAKSDGTCLRRLTNDSSNKSEPVFSPDGKTVYYTSDRGGSRQIYALEYIPPTIAPDQASACAAATPQVR